MKRFQLKNFGPIRDADITLGDLTVLVGPQASGKSLFVQLVKAVCDAGAIREDLKSHGFDWIHGDNLVADYSSLYFGGGLHSIVTSRSRLTVDGKHKLFTSIAKPAPKTPKDESAFLIPAQRVLVLQDGWPKPFMAYSVGDPYSMRRFSEALRVIMDGGLGPSTTLFPAPARLMAPLRRAVDEAIYIGAKLQLEPEGMRKRVVLSTSERGAPLPFNAWSAGQREFTPLLLSMYWLLPKTRRRGSLKTVIVEEPEMGLHPQAIVSFCLLVLALLERDYRVILSTHSPVILDIVWSLNSLRELEARKRVAALRKVFALTDTSAPFTHILDEAFGKKLRVYAFERTGRGVTTRDISTLDPGSDSAAEAGWGGLSGFSGQIAEAVGAALEGA